MDAGWTDTEYILTLCFQKKNTPAGDLNQISERLSSLFVKPMCSNVYFNGTRGSVCRNTPAGRRAIFTPGIHLVCVTLAFTNHKQQPQAVWNIVLATLLDSERQPALAACLPYCLKKKKKKSKPLFPLSVTCGSRFPWRMGSSRENGEDFHSLFRPFSFQ